ncbi:MAG: SUMF1/EgtB/PvdO family nonheme iron enzyme [Solirubrobacterales bacterium]
MLRLGLVALLALPLAVAGTSAEPSEAKQPVKLSMVPGGDAGNADDPETGFGGVAKAFRISRYTITLGQYTAFLNAVARRDPHRLYDPALATDLNVAGIKRTRTRNGLSYATIAPSGAVQSPGATTANRPVTYVTWFDAARFANWMSNGQPRGRQRPDTTENGAYNLRSKSARKGLAVARNRTNPNTGRKPRYFIPTENQWYKVSYYSPALDGGAGGYYDFGTLSNSQPGNTVSANPGQANYTPSAGSTAGRFSLTQQLSIDPQQNYLTEVGAFTASPGPYGTFDMNGNVWELNDGDATASNIRELRGGGWTSFFAYLQSSYLVGNPITAQSTNVGFRLASRLSPTASDWYRLSRDGDHGNRADGNGLGAVANGFSIGTFEVTIQQYCDFLNAVARTDSYGLWDQAMSASKSAAGIARVGSSGSYAYSVIDNAGSSASRPIASVSWLDAARLANWISNGRPTGDQTATTTEDGAYTLNGKTGGNAAPRNATNPNTGAAPTFWIPTEDQWYNAAFYKGGSTKAGYWLYATRSNSAPGNEVGGLANQVNYIDDADRSFTYSVPQNTFLDTTQNYLTDVGAFTGTIGAYGTMDNAGNVVNWNDLDGKTGPTRGRRGGFWFSGPPSIQSNTYNESSPSLTGADMGFRLASPR